jgi:predicted ATPase
MYLKSIAINAERFPNTDLYPFNIPAFRGTGRLDLSTVVTFFVGRNGSGKSTLLEAIARRSGLLPWGGTKVHRSHQNPYETQLANYLSLVFGPRHQYGFHFRAEAFFNFASSLDDIALDDPRREQYFGGRSLNVVSHGESFLAFFNSYSCQLDGLYLLDEPEAALSPENQVQFVKDLLRLQQQGRKQYIIATHSPIILACPGAGIMSFDNPEIRPTRYKALNHYKFYKEFLEDPERFFCS